VGFKRGKSIKKNIKIGLYLVVVLITVPLLLYSILLIPAIQTSVANYFTEQLSTELNTKISIKSVYFKPFKRLVLKDVIVYDQQQDTLAALGELSARIDSIYFKQKKVYFGHLEANEPQVKIKEGTINNYDFLTNAFKNKNTANNSFEWHLNFGSLKLHNGNINYQNDSLNSKHVVDQLEIDLSKINKDSLWHINVNNIQFVLNDDFELNSTKGQFHFNDSTLLASNCNITTYYSEINIDTINVKLKSQVKTINDVKNLYIRFNNSRIARNDVFKLTKVRRFPDIGISGELIGHGDNVKGRNVKINLGYKTQIATSFDINGLSDLNETFIYLNVDKLNSSPADLEQLLSLTQGKSLELPEAFKRLRTIHYKGNFTGFLTDMVAYGNFNTSLGKIQTDIGLKLNDENEFVFSGNLSTQQFNIGQLANAENWVNDVSMRIAINGKRKSADDFNAFLKGNIDTLTINNYKYQNIRINGLFANDKFDGDFLVDDPNGQVGFNGKIDLSGEIPNFKFKSQLTDIKLDLLNITQHYKNSSLTGDIEADFSGKDINDIVGYISINDLAFAANDQQFNVDSLLLISVREGDRKRVVLQSDIAEGDLVGTYNFNHITNTMKQTLLQFLPAFEPKLTIKEKDIKRNDFTFSCTLKNISKIISVLFPGTQVADNGLILGSYNSDEGKINLEGEIDFVNFNNIKITHPEIHISTSEDDKLMAITRIHELNLNDISSFQNLSLHQLAYQDTVEAKVFWNNWEDYTNSGSVITTTAIKSRDNGMYASMDILPSYVMVRDSLWEIQPTTAYYHPDGFSVKNFRVYHQNQEIGINGFAHRHTKDGITVHLQNISLSDVVGYRDAKQVQLSGFLNGSLDIQKLYTSPIFSGDLSINQFHFNNDNIGDLSVNAHYHPNTHQIEIGTEINKDDQKPLTGNGFINLANKQLELDFDTDQLEIGFLNLYLSKIMQNLSGTASGKLQLTGAFDAPQLLGALNINKAFFDVDLLKTTYSLKDSVYFKPNLIEFKNLQLSDRNGNNGSFNGTIEHSGFRNMKYDLTLLANNMLLLDTKYTDNQLYYGSVYADGNMSITGSTKDLIIDIAGETKEDSEFFIPLTDDESAEESNFIRFVDHTKPEDKKEDITVEDEYQIDLTGMTVSMDIDITTDARCQVIFDSTVGDILKARGNGNIQIKMDKEGGINFFGGYNIEDGDYMFTLQNVLNKRFVINQGSSINWDGNPYDANIDLNATYKLKASLLELNSEIGDAENTSRRIPVNCNLLLTERLTKPNVKFEIKTPSSQDNNQNIIDTYINTEEETNRQVLSLLVLNRFYSQETSSSPDNSNSSGNNAALVTTTEMLSNQLSHWLSQISNDIDIGVSYRPASELTDDEVEVALSTQMFNNRVIVNGNVEYGNDETRTNNLIGDFDVEVKLNSKGSLRAKAYTRTNNDLFYSTNSPTTQGIGVSFREEFDTLEELMHKYWLKLSGKGKDDKKETTKETKE